jgi:hypothetical protein
MSRNPNNDGGLGLGGAGLLLLLDCRFLCRVVLADLDNIPSIEP